MCVSTFPKLKIYDPRGEEILTKTCYTENFNLYVLGEMVLSQVVILPQEIYQLPTNDEVDTEILNWLEYWESECISSMCFGTREYDYGEGDHLG